MKKFNMSMILIAVVMLVGLTNCKKEDLKDSTPVSKAYVNAIDASFTPQDVNVSVAKSFPFDAPVAVTRTWYMYAKNSPFYKLNNVIQPFALVKGNEFVTGSAANIWWSSTNPVNNPVSFAASQAVYSNLTPAEPVRLVMETKDNSGAIEYLGILDFDPTTANFPLTVVGKRLGDVVTLNTDALTKLAGANLTITAKFNLSTINISATELLPILSSATSGSATGVTGMLGFSDIVYGSPEIQTPVTVPNGSGDFILYSGLDKKVFGDIIITITEAPSASSPGVTGSTIVLTVPASSVGLAGKSTKITLKTTKLGWYDSTPIGTQDVNIETNSVDITL